ncbi:DNA-binding NarL/FixJ family response regulator [Ochrobactrum daejeonense]|uniref:DNA-binding NarL/FixJ family response regulator n=1 Tax=Brucella daejeonensis TaxID=659015 RepID=A0A7W9AXL9_9HYPH|nr:response regulator transcription factor [Brucella daejeonensis]MBB5702490.1 DNA-binding NarL/FixJ family response regulator [Brucella daejeonensis]
MLETRGDSLWARRDDFGDRGDAAAIEAAQDRRILLVCKSNLERQCLQNGLAVNGLKLQVETQSVIECADPADDIAVVLIHIGSKRLADPFFSEKLHAVIELWRPVPVVFLAEREEWTQVVRALEIGARGYIPTSVDIKVCVEALHLAAAGGMYVPASIAFQTAPTDVDDDVLGELLTAREIEVVHAIRIGKSNKIIAFELGMSEGTVKAHVHNIMKKIGAANRTEVACKLHRMYGERFDLD